jgi:xanthine dehydrogenase YagS FAD-binding subunit
MRDFKLAQPENISQAVNLLDAAADTTKLMAGGTDLLDEIKNETIRPEIVVDLNRVPGLDRIVKDRDRIRIGALTRVAALGENAQVRDALPGLHQAARSLASPQLRNVGTLGGNLCQRPRCWYYRDPQVVCRKKGGSRCYAYRGRNRYHAIFGGGTCYIVFPSDLAPALICLGAEATITSPKGSKTVPLEELYALPRVNVRRETILDGDECLTEIGIPLPKPGFLSTYLKFKERGTWDFAVVSVALNAEIRGGNFGDVSIVCGGVAPIPWRLRKAEVFLKGKPIAEGPLREAVRRDLEDANPLEENAYKLALLETAVYRAGLSLLG